MYLYIFFEWGYFEADTGFKIMPFQLIYIVPYLL